MHEAVCVSEGKEKKEWVTERKKTCFLLKADHQNEFIKTGNGHNGTSFEKTLDNEHWMNIRLWRQNILSFVNILMLIFFIQGLIPSSPLFWHACNSHVFFLLIVSVPTWWGKSHKYSLTKLEKCCSISSSWIPQVKRCAFITHVTCILNSSGELKTMRLCLSGGEPEDESRPPASLTGTVMQVKKPSKEPR